MEDLLSVLLSAIQGMTLIRSLGSCSLLSLVLRVNRDIDNHCGGNEKVLLDDSKLNAKNRDTESDKRKGG